LDPPTIKVLSTIHTRVNINNVTAVNALKSDGFIKSDDLTEEQIGCCLLL